jgi:8-oxo-dGTP pyrophosphatase MutT (NUDIX family)
MTSDPNEELVDVIDDAGRVVRTVSRREMRGQRLPHRCTYILVFDQQGHLFIHLRTPTKDVFPSHWDVCVGGVLAAGETFADGARRELHEELGIDAAPVEQFPFRYVDEHSFAHGMVYHVLHDGPFQLQADEIVRGEFIPVAEVLARAASVPFCPDGLCVLKEYQTRYSEEARAQQPVAYSVRVSFTDATVADEWLAWLQAGHVAEVLGGGATDAEIVELDGPIRSFEVRYHFPTRAAFAAYERDHAPRLRAEGLRRFPIERGVVYQRAVGYVRGTLPRL